MTNIAVGSSVASIDLLESLVDDFASPYPSGRRGLECLMLRRLFRVTTFRVRLSGSRAPGSCRSLLFSTALHEVQIEDGGKSTAPIRLLHPCFGINCKAAVALLESKIGGLLHILGTTKLSTVATREIDSKTNLIGPTFCCTASRSAKPEKAEHLRSTDLKQPISRGR